MDFVEEIANQNSPAIIDLTSGLRRAGSGSEKEHDDKRTQLIARREKIMNELEAHNNADDSFNDTIIDVLNLASNAHEIFRLSTTEKKRKLINLVRIDQ